MNRISQKSVRAKAGSVSAVFLLALLTIVATSNLVLCICHDTHVSIDAVCNLNQCCPKLACDTSKLASLGLSAPISSHPCLSLSFGGAAKRAVEARIEDVIVVSIPETPGILLAIPGPPIPQARISPISGHLRRSANDVDTRFVVLTI